MSRVPASDAAGLAGLLWQRGAATPGQLAVIENERGRWKPVTAGQLAERVGALAVALSGRGVGRSTRVAVLVGGRAAWLEVDLAVQCAGGVSVAVPADDDDEVLARRMEGLGLDAVVIDNEVTLQRLLALVGAERIDPLRLVVRLGESDADAVGTDELVASGRQLMAAQPRLVDELLSGRSLDDPAAITFTAGASGRPRPIVHTAAALLAGARQVATARRLGTSDVGVVALDPAHPFERSVTIYPALVSGAVLAFPESPATTARAMLEVQPTFAHLPIDKVREVAAGVRARFSRNRGLKRLVARNWRRSARRRRAPSAIGRRLVGAPALRTLGWGNVQSLVVTSAAVPDDVFDTIGALGLTVESGYAVVEAGLVGMSRRGGGFVPLDGTTVSARDGVLDVAGPALAAGVASGRELDRSPSGGLSTGDCGRAEPAQFDVDGPAGSRLVVGGVDLLAGAVERHLRQSRYVALAVVSEREGGVHASIEIDRTAVGAWAGDRGLHFTTYSSLVGLDEVAELIATEVAGVAPEVASHDLLHQPLQQGRDITRTRTTVHRRLDQVGTEQASPPVVEPASALE